MFHSKNLKILEFVQTEFMPLIYEHYENIKTSILVIFDIFEVKWLTMCVSHFTSKYTDFLVYIYHISQQVLTKCWTNVDLIFRL